MKTRPLLNSHSTKPGDLDVPSKTRIFLDNGRWLCISAWCPSVKINEAVLVTIEGTLFMGSADGCGAVHLGGDGWTPGETEPPMEGIELEDGRALWCKSWKVQPADRDRGRTIGDTRRDKELPEVCYQAVHVTMECYLMTEEDDK